MKKFILNIYFKLLGFLAKNYLKRTKPEIIWITWTIWKTSARMIIHQILEKNIDKKIYTSPKNFNWELWMVFSIFCIQNYKPSIFGLLKVFFTIVYKSFFSPKLYDIILLEYWVDHIWEMDFLLSIVKPNIWIFTKIDKVHSLQFGNPDIIAKEKFKLIKDTKEIVFLNYDDSYSRSIYPDIKIDKFYYDSAGNCWNETDICVKNYEIIKDNNIVWSTFNCILKWKKEIKIQTNLTWDSNISYICVWFSILDIYYYRFYQKNFFENQKNIKIDFELQPWRLTFLQGINNSIIVDSSYNSSPLSMRKNIENIYKIKTNLYPDYKLILCLWDMRELWDFTEQEHRLLAQIIFWASDNVFLVWENMKKFTADELTKIWFNPKNIYCFSNSKLAWIELKKFFSKNNEKYIILFKWSQNTIFLEEAIKSILANKQDANKLPRQSDYWLTKKERFFGK